MKNYIVYALVSAVVFSAILIALNAIFGSLQTVKFYIINAVVYAVVFGLFHYLVDKKGKKK